MGMRQSDIDGVVAVLQRWNPLGAAATRVLGLNGYETEAIGIISVLSLGMRSPEAVLQSVINQAFELNVSLEECASPAAEILKVLK